MTLYFFNILDTDQQQQIVLKKGVELGERRTPLYKVVLYQVDGFYVEVYYHFHFNVVHKIRSFTDTKSLAPYLKNISLVDLSWVVWNG